METRLSLGIAACALLTPSTLAQSFDSPDNYATPTRPDQSAAADFDGDGDRDIAVTTDAPDKVTFLRNDGAGGFSFWMSVLTGAGTSPAAIAAEDFDGDGDMDLAVTLKNTGALLLLTNTGGSFAPGTPVSVGGSEPRQMATGDVNADGLLDVVTSNRESSTVSVMLGTGTGFSLAGTFSAGDESRGVDLADFDGDCDLDMVVGSHDDRTVRTLRNNGSGSFSAWQTLSVSPARPDGVVTADFDGDLVMDFAVSISDDTPPINAVRVYVNPGGGTFGFGMDAATGGLNPDSMFAADFDGDGDKDVAVTNQDSNEVSILSNAGTGALALVQEVSVGTRPGHITGSDFDGNGSIDLVAANRDSDNVSVLLNQGSGGGESYCSGAPNSAGAGASIDYAGALSLGAGSFELTARCCPSGQPGIFYYGSGQSRIPFGEGLRCVSGGIVRLLPPVTTSGSGTARRSAGVADGLAAGTTINFQFWYRDPVGGGSAFNLSDALSAVFRP